MTRLRAIPANFDPDALGAIDRSLAKIRQAHAVTICLAIESGSRAWGFPSPDSDYDCRFIYVRCLDDYLSRWQKRDVIELPLEGDLDINGWDLGKALKLLVKGNAVVVEWLTSPIVYDGDRDFHQSLSAFAARHADRTGVERHYLHLGEKQRRTYFADNKLIQLKKLFYALRPAAALRWLRFHPDKAIAPMHFPTLLSECQPPSGVAALTADLIARKAETRELGVAPLPKVLETFIDDEFALAHHTLPARSTAINAETVAAADQLFRSAVTRFEIARGSTSAAAAASTAR